MTSAQASSSSTPPPPPLDDPSVSNPLECPPLRWGLVGCGRVCHDFTLALSYLPTQTVVACSTASDAARAQEFAQKHKIAKACTLLIMHCVCISRDNSQKIIKIQAH